jgi:hypothetical protein
LADALGEGVEGPGAVAGLADAVGEQQQAVAGGEGDGVDLVYVPISSPWTLVISKSH